MAQNFKRQALRNVGTNAAPIGGYQVGNGAQVTLIGLSVANVADVRGTVDLYITNGGNTVAYLVKNAPLPVGASLIVVGGDQKVVLQAGDQVMAQVNAGASGDVLMSLLELT